MSVMESEPYVFAFTFHVTVIVQELPATRVLPHVLVWVKPLLTAMLVIVSAELPVFESVTT